MAGITPNQTLYVRNLQDTLKVDDLRKQLYLVFSQFGKILEVAAKKTPKLRGQAWICFANIASATNALRSMQDAPFFEKQIKLSYAKETSLDAVAMAEGKYTTTKRKERQKPADDGRGAPVKQGPAAEPPTRRARTQDAADQGPANKLLFVDNLPEATTAQMLELLFKQFPGYQEVRTVDARPGIAFVEFENDMQASIAMQGLQDFHITPTKAMAISYAKQ